MRPLTRTVAVAAAAAAALSLAAPLLAPQDLREFLGKPEPLTSDAAEIEVLPVQGPVHLIATGGSNITVQTGTQGPLLVDSGNAEASAAVVEALAGLSHLPPRVVINTSPLAGHIAGNKAIFDVGTPIPGTDEGLGMPIVGHQNGVNRMASGALGDVPVDLWPFNTFFGDKKALYVNGESLELLHMPNAITDSDVMVWFRRSDVLATGDIFDTTGYPRIRTDLGGSLEGVIAALNRVIDITIPAFNQQGGTLVVPGHGRIASESDVVEVRDMLTIIRDRVAAMADLGMSFEDVVAARPALEYDGLYGSDTGDWTTRMFLEVVYDEVREER
jgi:glyoxylase-like metal-dependent hydrolase (beta-lactamase superfamily II)